MLFTSGTNTVTSPSITVSNADESAICAQNSGTTVTVTNPTIVSSSAGTNANDSSFYGTDAAILAYGPSATSGSGATITVTNGTINTTGAEGNGVFAAMGGTVNISGTTISAMGGNAHGLDAANQGTLNITNVTANTASASSSVVATDSGGGTVTVHGGTYTASGQRSAGIYSTGTVTVYGGTFTAANAEAVVLEGLNSVTIDGTNATYGTTKLTGAAGDYRGIFLYQSPSGDASSGTASFTMTDGAITYNCPVTSTSTTCASGSTSSGQNNPATLFSVANTTATISLTDVTVTNNTSTTTNSYGTLLTAQALNSGTWGTAGSNGGNVTFTTMGTAVTGDVIVDNISTATVQIYKDSTQAGSTLTGAINSANTGKTVSLVLDSASKWIVTGTSYLTTLAGLTLNGTTVSNIDGGGHCVYYSGSINGSTSTTTYTLSGNSGGYLAPKGTTGLTCD
jgi:hypothetical protein